MISGDTLSHNDVFIDFMVDTFCLVVSSDASPLLGVFAMSDCRCRSYIGRDFFPEEKQPRAGYHKCNKDFFPMILVGA